MYCGSNLILALLIKKLSTVHILVQGFDALPHVLNRGKEKCKQLSGAPAAHVFCPNGPRRRWVLMVQVARRVRHAYDR